MDYFDNKNENRDSRFDNYDKDDYNKINENFNKAYKDITGNTWESQKEVRKKKVISKKAAITLTCIGAGCIIAAFVVMFNINKSDEIDMQLMEGVVQDRYEEIVSNATGEELQDVDLQDDEQRMEIANQLAESLEPELVEEEIEAPEIKEEVSGDIDAKYEQYETNYIPNEYGVYIVDGIYTSDLSQNREPEDGDSVLTFREVLADYPATGGDTIVKGSAIYKMGYMDPNDELLKWDADRQEEAEAVGKEIIEKYRGSYTDFIQDNEEEDYHFRIIGTTYDGDTLMTINGNSVLFNKNNGVLSDNAYYINVARDGEVEISGGVWSEGIITSIDAKFRELPLYSDVVYKDWSDVVSKGNLVYYTSAIAGYTDEELKTELQQKFEEIFEGVGNEYEKIIAVSDIDENWNRVGNGVKLFKYTVNKEVVEM